MTFTSSPGFSLMLEGISYMIGAELPGVFVNVMRGGPGLGNIGPEQADIKLACRGLGHGNTHAHRARARDAAGDARPDDAAPSTSRSPTATRSSSWATATWAR